MSLRDSVQNDVKATSERLRFARNSGIYINHYPIIAYSKYFFHLAPCKALFGRVYFPQVYSHPFFSH